MIPFIVIAAATAASSTTIDKDKPKESKQITVHKNQKDDDVIYYETSPSDWIH